MCLVSPRAEIYHWNGHIRKTFLFGPVHTDLLKHLLFSPGACHEGLEAFEDVPLLLALLTCIPSLVRVFFSLRGSDRGYQGRGGGRSSSRGGDW